MTSSPISNGPKRYHGLARRLLPVLVRQAQSGNPITYTDAANEIGASGPRDLNYALGTIGEALASVSENWGEPIPPIQCLVVKKDAGVPGSGIGQFIHKHDFGELTRAQQKQVVKAHLNFVYGFSKWNRVLEELGLKRLPKNFSGLVQAAIRKQYRGTESREHEELKQRIAENPALIGLPRSFSRGKTEHRLPSSDTIDVIFQNSRDCVGVEVKSCISDDADVVRGIFQVVKYKAILEAQHLAENMQMNLRVYLVCGRSLSKSMTELSNMLGVTVVTVVQ